MKSKLPAIINPTRDAAWDDYYKTVWTIFGPVIFFFLLIIGVAIYNTYVRHIGG